MELERKQFGASVTTEGETGIVEAIVSVFGNTDAGGDIVQPGAFKASLSKRTPKGVWAHQWDMPIAKTLEARETDKGLYVKGQFNLETQRGREAFSDIKFGIIDEFSIGYRVVEDSVNHDDGTRSLVTIDLYEWSPVLVGMNAETELLSIKSDVPATFAKQSENVLAYNLAWADRAKSLVDLRVVKEGRVLSGSNRTRISACADSMESTAAALRELLTLTEPVAKAADSDIRAVYAEILQTMNNAFHTIGRT